MDLDGLGVELEAFFLVDEEFLDVLALIALELNHLAHLRVVHDGAIAGELLLDDLENLLLVEFLGKTLVRGQGFATIALCEAFFQYFCGVSRGLRDDARRELLTLNTDVDVVLRLLGLASVFVGLREGV